MEDKRIFKQINQSTNNSEFEENKIIVEDLLQSLRHKTLEDFIHQVEILVKDLNIYHCDRPINAVPKNSTELYYAIHFETLDLSTINKDLDSITVYIGLGLDLDMQRKVLGFWLKRTSDNPYKFWLKVCQQLKDSGILSIEIKEYHNQYWLTEAMNQIFSSKTLS